MLTEKVVWALWLLEGLASSSLPFIFKGGTALMLKLGSTRRLSIDIDIVMPLREESLAEVLNKIAKEQGFIRAEEQHRETESIIPKTHFKFFYRPQFQNAQETYVLLDILFGNAGYQTIKTISIESPFVLSDGKATQVQIPSFEDLTGDNKWDGEKTVEGTITPYLNRLNMSAKVQGTLAFNRVLVSAFFIMPFGGQPLAKNLEEHWGLNKQQSTFLLNDDVQGFLFGFKGGYRLK